LLASEGISAHPPAIVDLSVRKWIELMKSVRLPIGIKKPIRRVAGTI